MRPRPDEQREKKVLAIASGGGHWVQLCRVAPAFADCRVVYATVRESYAHDVPGARLHVVQDATRWDRWRLLVAAFQVLCILIRERPDVVFTTGAAPGAIAVVLGRLFGARTIWLDSIANVDAVSGSGRLVSRFADLRLTQWPHLAAPDGPEFAGAVF